MKLESYKDTDEIWHLLNLEIKATGFSELLLVDEEQNVYKNGSMIWEMQDDMASRRFLVDKKTFVFLNYKPKDKEDQNQLNDNLAMENDNLLYGQPMEITEIGGKKYIGIIGYYDLDSIRISMQNQFYYNKGLAQVVNADGLVIATENAWESREPENLLSGMKSAEFLEGDSYPEIVEKIKSKEQISSVFMQNGEKMILIAEPIEKADWMVITTIPISVMENQTLVVLRMTLILLTLFAAVIGILLLYGFFRYRSRMFRKSSQEIYYRERLFNLLSIHTDDVFAVVNKINGEVQFVSENIKRTMRIDVNEYKEKYALDLALPREMRADVKNQIEKLVQEEREDARIHADFEFEWRIPKTGEVKWLHTTAYLVKEDIFDSTEGCLILIISDYTKVRENQKTLDRAIKEAQEAVRSRSSFLSNMSHEMRTPLNGIIGCINIMQKRIYDPDSLKSYLHKAELTANYLLTLINDVLDMSKIESKKFPPRFADF